MRLPLALTMGEPASIASELTLQAWQQREQQQLPSFVAIADADWLKTLASQLGWLVPITRVRNAADALQIFGEALPVLHQPLNTPVRLGTPDPAHSSAILGSIAQAVTLVQRGECSAVVTNPIHKASLQASGFGFPGHTEYLADLTQSSQPVMLLTSETLGLRVVPLTIHVPLHAVPQLLSVEKIVATAEIILHALRDRWKIDKPRLAVSGLNPHAGETGKFGTEEQTIIAPAIALLHNRGWLVSGPMPADSLFHAEARQHYDCALCMYHDQALIPLKTLDIWGGVNTTLGLPLIRTSPDHGTALSLAGRGVARVDSLVAALRLAAALSA